MSVLLLAYWCFLLLAAGPRRSTGLVFIQPSASVRQSTWTTWRRAAVRIEPCYSTAAGAKEEEVDLEDFVSDFIQDYAEGENNCEHQEDALNATEGNADAQGGMSVLDFVQAVEKTPPGALGPEKVSLLREIMTSVSVTNMAQSKHDNDSAPVVVERLLYRMLDEWEAVAKRRGNDIELVNVLQPRTNDFLLAVQAWQNEVGAKPIPSKPSSMSQQSAVEHVWDLYKTMEELISVGVPSIKADEQVAVAVMQILSASRERGVDRKARSVFDNMKRKHGVAPTVEMYRSLITALAKSRESGAANRAESFLREAVELFPPGLDATGRPSGIAVDSFNVVLTAWAKSAVDYGPERAEKLIVYMDKLDRENGDHGIARPNASSFTSLLDAYAQKLEWDSVSQAERVFNRLLDQYLEGEVEEPNVATWTIVLSAWAKMSRKRNRGAAPRADRLMRRMESLYKEGRISFGPDAIVYISTMNAWAFSKTVEGPEEAQKILDEMYELYLDGDDTMKPTAKSIRVVLESWIRSDAPDAMDRAEQLLFKLEDHLYSMCDLGAPVPDDVSDVYKTMLFGWTQHGNPQQAHEYLIDMVENNMEIDSACFERVIDANTLVNDEGSMDRTKAVFKLMEECTQKGQIKPNERVYTSFIRAMTKARVPSAASKSHMLVKHMQELGQLGDNKSIRPTVFTYNAVLRACAESAQHPNPLEAFKIAIKMFNELRSLSSDHQELSPDHVSYGNMLRCANLIPVGEQKDALIRSTFQLCCRSGYVNEFVLRDLQSVASGDLRREILRCPPETEISVERLPASWRRMHGMKEQRKNEPVEVRRFRR